MGRVSPAAADDDEHAISYLALKRGAPVHAAGGEQVGTVHRVQDNAREHIFDGIVIATAGGRRFVDAPEVAHISNRRVTLTITEAEVAELPEQTRAARAGRRWRRWFPGR